MLTRIMIQHAGPTKPWVHRIKKRFDSQGTNFISKKRTEMTTKEVFVLLADDDPGDQEKMQMALRRTERQTKLDMVANGMQLLDYLVKQHGSRNRRLPDLIITDLYMPFAGGLHVLKQIRKKEEFRHIPIYVFSANYDNTIRNKVLEHGATEFHRKPADFTALQEIVNSILSKSAVVTVVA